MEGKVGKDILMEVGPTVGKNMEAPHYHVNLAVEAAIYLQTNSLLVVA